MLNNVCLMGRLVHDPEMKSTPNNVPVTAFRIAVERNYAENGERKSDFINIVAWRKTAEFVVKYFHKGSLIALTGTLQMREYTASDNSKRTVAEVIADNVFFAESKSSQNQTSTQPKANSKQTAPQPLDFDDFVDVDDEDDLPF